MEEWWHYPLLVIVGFVVGFINTVAGGASLISLPVLIFLGFPPEMANGTNRIPIAVQTATAAAGFKSKGVSVFKFSIYLGIAAMFGAAIGAYLGTIIDPDSFKTVLVIIMVGVLLILLFKPKMNHTEMIERITGKYQWLGMLTFFFIGIYGGFINAGIGFVIIMYLHHVHRMTLVRSNATKVVAVCIYTLVALAVYWWEGAVHWQAGLVLAVGQGVGAWISGRYSVKKGDKFIKMVLAAMIVAMAIKLVYDII